MCKSLHSKINQELYEKHTVNKVATIKNTNGAVRPSWRFHAHQLFKNPLATISNLLHTIQIRPSCKHLCSQGSRYVALPMQRKPSQYFSNHYLNIFHYQQR